jgi:hypothetical protein
MDACRRPEVTCSLFELLSNGDNADVVASEEEVTNQTQKKNSNRTAVADDRKKRNKLNCRKLVETKMRKYATKVN